MFSCSKNELFIISGNTMGTTYLVKIFDPQNNNSKFIDLYGSIDSLLNQINNYLSTYIDSSEINVFNNNISKEAFNASQSLYEVVEKSLYYYKSSMGSFDITIGPIVEEWGFSSNYDISMLPETSKINSLLKHTGSDKILLDKGLIYKLDSLLKIDLGAIAKGWAVDEIAELLEALDIYNYLIEIGGEILVSGYNEDSNIWEIGIRSPENGKLMYDTIKLTNRAVAKSGTYQNFYNYDGVEYSHLINPVDGFPIKHEIVSATVITSKCIDADAIATAIMVKGAESGLEWIDSLYDVEALVIIKNKDGDFITKMSYGFNYH